jgi:hypothetical protein
MPASEATTCKPSPSSVPASIINPTGIKFISHTHFAPKEVKLGDNSRPIMTRGASVSFLETVISH